MRYSRRIAGATPLPEPPDARLIGEVELPHIPDAGRCAREFLEQRLRRRVADSVLDDTKLVATELVNNAVVHGEGRITLRAELRDGAVRVEVIDQGTGNAPKIREEARAADLGGRGLRIVDAISVRWGTFEGTTHVWADVAPARA